MWLLLLLSLLSFVLAHRSIAHAQTIVIRQSDFASAGNFSGAANTNLSGAPMPIVPATIGRPEPGPAQSPSGIRPGLLVPRATDAPAIVSTVVVDDATPLVSEH